MSTQVGITGIVASVRARPLALGSPAPEDRAVRRPTRSVTSWTARWIAAVRGSRRWRRHRAASRVPVRSTQPGHPVVPSDRVGLARPARFSHPVGNQPGQARRRPAAAKQGLEAFCDPIEFQVRSWAGRRRLASNAGMNTRLASNVHPRLINSSFPMLDVPG
jgi:hypothetical protein